jgi:hypothetical protein
MSNTENINLFKESVIKSIDNKKCHIIPAIQNIILNFGNNENDFNLPEGVLIAGKSTNLNPKGINDTQSIVWVPLIWNALKLLNYRVPDEWLKIDLEDNKKEELLKLSKKLSEIENWDKYAIEVLINVNDSKFEDNDNDFYSEKVNQLSEKYSKSCIDKNLDHLKLYKS